METAAVCYSEGIGVVATNVWHQASPQFSVGCVLYHEWKWSTCCSAREVWVATFFVKVIQSMVWPWWLPLSTFIVSVSHRCLPWDLCHSCQQSIGLNKMQFYALSVLTICEVWGKVLVTGCTMTAHSAPALVLAQLVKKLLSLNWQDSSFHRKAYKNSANETLFNLGDYAAQSWIQSISTYQSENCTTEWGCLDILIYW